MIFRILITNGIQRISGLIRRSFQLARIPLFSDPVPPPPRTPVRFRHATLFSYWENPSTLFRIQETTLRDLFSFWKIQEGNNQPIDIGRPNGFFQCIISGSNVIHRYRKKPYQIEIFSFDHISTVNTIYKDRYYKEYYTLDREISIAC